MSDCHFPFILALPLTSISTTLPPTHPPTHLYTHTHTHTQTGTLNMLGLAKRVRARMLLTSTSEVYGDPQVHPQPETYWGNVNSIGPRACYDEGKRVAETMMYAYKTQGEQEVRVARIFNTFGPRMHPNDGRVVSNFIIQVRVCVYVCVCVCVCWFCWEGECGMVLLSCLSSLHSTPLLLHLTHTPTPTHPHTPTGPARKKHHHLRRWLPDTLLPICGRPRGRAHEADE